MTWLGTGIATVGALLCLVAAIGLVRLPDALSRLEAVTKASVLGLVLTLVGCVVLFPTPAVAVQAALVAAFLLLVAPVSAHLVGRATYRSGLRGELVRDESPGARLPSEDGAPSDPGAPSSDARDRDGRMPPDGAPPDDAEPPDGTAGAR